MLCLTVSYSAGYDGNCDTSPTGTNADILRPYTPSPIIETMTIVGQIWIIVLACNSQIMGTMHNHQPQSENPQLMCMQNHMETIGQLLTRKYR